MSGGYYSVINKMQGCYTSALYRCKIGVGWYLYIIYHESQGSIINQQL